TGSVPSGLSQCLARSTAWSRSVPDGGRHEMPEEISTSIQHPVIVYLALGIAAATMIVNAFPKILGPLGNALMDWSRRRREARIAEEDFRIKDLREENDYLKDHRARYVRREHRWAMEANRA